MSEIDLIVNEIVKVSDTKGAERKEYLKMIVSILMHGGRLEEVKNVKIHRLAGCCF